MRVASGAIGRKYLKERLGIEIKGYLSQLGPIQLEAPDLEFVDKNPFFCRRIQDPGQGDSIGAKISVLASNVPPGLGEPVFDKLEADLARGLMSLPASKGFEIGSGFGGTHMTGIEHNDPFTTGENGRTHTTSNRSGGVQGGITNGEDIVLRVAFKPTATISQPQQTVNRSGEAVVLEARGRHDPCVLPRAVPIVEAMVCLVLADHFLRQRGVDVLPALG